MLSCSETFKNVIKSRSREGIKSKIVCTPINQSETIILENGNSIVDFTLSIEGKKDLGFVVRKVADITLIANQLTTQIKRGSVLNIYFVINSEDVQICTLYVNSIKNDNSDTYLTLECLDPLTYLDYNNTNIVPISTNITAVHYLQSIFNTYGYSYDIDNGIKNPNLIYAYPYSSSLISTLDQLSVAMQCTIDFTIDFNYGLFLPFDMLPEGAYFNQVVGSTPKAIVKPFWFDNSTDTCDYVDTLISYKIIDSNVYKDVKFNLFFPNSGQEKSIGTIQATVPASTYNYNIGNVSFDKPIIPSYCVIDCDIDIATFSIGGNGASFMLTNRDTIAKTINVEIAGSEINESTLNDTDTDNDIKQVSNMYIQSGVGYDGRVFLNNEIEVKCGNPLYEVGDTITIDGKTVLIYNHKISYNGALKSTIKGVILNE